jgi:hypothetical protein
MTAKTWKKALICAAKVGGQPMGTTTMQLMLSEAKEEVMVGGKTCLRFADGSVLNLGTGETFTKKQWDGGNYGTRQD